MEITPGLLFLALKAKFLPYVPMINMMVIIIFGLLLQSLFTFAGWFVRSRQRIGLLLGVFFDLLSFRDFMRRLFVGSHQIDDLTFKTYFSLQSVFNLVLELPDLLKERFDMPYRFLPFLLFGMIFRNRSKMILSQTFTSLMVLFIVY